MAKNGKSEQTTRSRRRVPPQLPEPTETNGEMPELVMDEGSIATAAPPEEAERTIGGKGIVHERHLRTIPREDEMPAEAGAAGGGDVSSATIVDGGGTVLTQVHVQLIFWGSAWTNPGTTPSAGAVTSAVQNVLTGPYMTKLSQYRGVGTGVLRGTTMVTGSNPPNPFTDQNVKDLVSNLIDGGTLPEPDDEGIQLLYCVIMPPLVGFTNSNVIGEHTYDTDYDFPFDFDKIWIAWVTNNGTLDGVTTIFSHELAEAATDPEGNGIQVAPASPTNWNEIADICTSTGRVNGVRVQSYWSASDNACVIPTGLPRWTSLGGQINGGLTAIRNQDGRLEVFARGTDAALWHQWQTAPNNGWSGWATLGGWITGRNVVAANADGRIEVFVRGSDGALWHQWQTAPNNAWSGWASLGGLIDDLFAVARNADGRLEVFARGSDGALWHIWQVAPNGGWSGWQSLGGQILTAVAVAQNQDGRLEVFAKGLDGAVWHQWQTAPNNGWSGWGSLGGIINDVLTAAPNADGRIEVFARGTDNALWHQWQTAPNNGWSGWASMGGIIADLLAADRNADGRLEVFVRGTDNGLWHVWQTAPNNGWNT